MADDTKAESSQTPHGAELRTFLIADIRGYTRYTREQGDDAASAVAARFAGIVRASVTEFDGELLELRGDEALCVFASARQALRASVELQRQLRTPARGEEPFPLGVGVGLDAGEAVPTEGGYRGSALNLAARLCSTAAGGQVLATERLVGLAGPVAGVHWSRPRPVRLKGVAEPERIVTVESDEALPPAPSPAAALTSHGWRPMAGAALALAVIVVLSAVVLIERGGKTVAPAVATPRQSVAVIDIARGRVIKDVRLSSTPESIVTGGGYVWVGSAQDNVTPINETTYRAGPPMGLCCNPDYLAFGRGALWAFDDGSAHLVEIDPRQGVVAQRRLWHCKPGQFTQLSGCAGGGVVVVGNEVWVGRANGAFSDVHAGSLVRLRTSDLSQIGTVRHVVVGLLATDGTQVWSFGNEAVEADAVQIAPLQVIYHQPLPEEQLLSSSRGGLAMGFGAAWVGHPRGNLYRLRTDGAFMQRFVGGGINAVATSKDAVWVARSNSVEKVSPANGQVIHTYSLGRADPVALAVTGGRVWVALA